MMWRLLVKNGNTIKCGKSNRLAYQNSLWQPSDTIILAWLSHRPLHIAAWQMVITSIFLSLHTFLQAKPPALDGFARLGYHGWRHDITKCHVCAKGAACSNNDGVAVLTGRERACCGSCSLTAPDGGQESLSYYVSHSGPFSPSPFLPLVSLAHLLTPCWTSVVISRHFTTKSHHTHGGSSFCKTQRKK